MGTSRSETVEAATPAGRVTVSGQASPEQVAAIAAAVGAHVSAQRAAAALAAESGDEPDRWDGERFAFAGRLEGVAGRGGRVPREAPTDRWTAADRRDRFDR